ncbi:MAG TPA: hypothetical protein VH137_09600, partial [Gemmatimonadales bacterium]|nr:hypothetical protein [Gemmatimonadales bacterium]
PGSTASGVEVVAPGAEAEFLLGFALGELPGVGPKFQERLGRLGLRTVRDVVARDLKTLVAWLGKRAGTWLYGRVRGIDDSSVTADRAAKSISRDETFAVDLHDDTALSAKLSGLADRATADLRDAGLGARTVTVKLRDADFTTRQASRTLPEPVQSDRAVYTVARELLGRLRGARRVPARLLGVSLSQLAPLAADDQLALLEPAPSVVETDRDRAIARAMDAVRDKFGPDALGRGGARES